MIKKEIIKTIQLNNDSDIFSILSELSDLKEINIKYKVQNDELILYKEIELIEEEEVKYKIKLIEEQNRKVREKIEQLYKRIRFEEDFYKENHNEVNKLLIEYSNIMNKKIGIK